MSALRASSTPAAAGVHVRVPAAPALDMGVHAENRARLAAALRAAGVAGDAVVVLAGGASPLRADTDHEELFRQESFFHWAFGVREPDWLGALRVRDGRAVLFAPRLPATYAVWMGALRGAEAWRALYGVDAVRYADEVAAGVRAELGAAPPALLLLRGVNSDSGAEAVPARFEGAATLAAAVDETTLFPAIVECRVFKSAGELALLRHASDVSSAAHLAVMRHAAPGLRESQLESLFRHTCHYGGGARYLSYTCICASGANGAVLHYGHAGEPNGRALAPGDLCLFDMGCEFACYGADITCTFPAGGAFSAPQALVYRAVLAAVDAVEAAMAPGVAWPDMHALAYRALLAGLAAPGGPLRPLPTAAAVEEALAAGVGAVFMPHGLGHFLGIDTHDVGGYGAGAPPRDARAGFAKLRTARVLAAGMYITVEPGCYFGDYLLDAALADPARARFLDTEALARYRGMGGVRIEDDVLVTADGCDVFTRVPRTVEEVEAAVAGAYTDIDQLPRRGYGAAFAAAHAGDGKK